MRKMILVLLSLGILGSLQAGDKQWDDLTITEKQQVQDLTRSLRAYAIGLAKLSNLGSGISAAWGGGTATVIDSLANNAVIPNDDTSLAGAQPLSQADVSNMAGYAIDLSNPANSTPGGGYNTAFIRTLDVKMSGIVNTIGQ